MALNIILKNCGFFNILKSSYAISLVSIDIKDLFFFNFDSYWFLVFSKIQSSLGFPKLFFIKPPLKI